MTDRRGTARSLECGPKKSTPGKFAYIRHFQRIGINATKFEKTLIHFKSDVFAAVAVVDAKTPHSWESAGLPSGRPWVQPNNQGELASSC